jgi:hypothetical protein
MTHFAGVRSPLGSHIQRRPGTPLQTSQLGRSKIRFKRVQFNWLGIPADSN